MVSKTEIYKSFFSLVKTMHSVESVKPKLSYSGWQSVFLHDLISVSFLRYSLSSIFIKNCHQALIKCKLTGQDLYKRGLAGKTFVNIITAYHSRPPL